MGIHVIPVCSKSRVASVCAWGVDWCEMCESVSSAARASGGPQQVVNAVRNQAQEHGLRRNTASVQRSATTCQSHATQNVFPDLTRNADGVVDCCVLDMLLLWSLSLLL